MSQRRFYTAGALLGLVLLLHPRDGLADDAGGVPSQTDFILNGYEFVERQYFLLSPQSVSINEEENGLIFEAQLALHVPLAGFRLGSQSDPEVGFVSDARLLFTFLSRIRMTADDSSPVVTPSYMPRLRFQVLNRRVYESGVELQLGGTALIAHHSNGQQGCTFRDGAGNTTMPDADGEAVCISPENAEFLNEDGGSFSTNYYALALHGRVSFDSQPMRRSPSLYMTATVEHHPEGFLSVGALDEDLATLWGNLHLDFQVEARVPLLIGSRDLHWLEPYALLELYAANKGRDPRLPLVEIDNHRVMVEGGVVCPKCFRLGLFARGVFGRDYYNIQFSQSPSRFQIGIVFDTSFGQIPPRELRSSDPGHAPGPAPD